DGKVRWSYQNPAYSLGRVKQQASKTSESSRNRKFQTTDKGIMTSALVTEDMVFFGDMGGWFYALGRTDGTERWKLDSRAKEFPGAHPINLFFASPILADGKLIVGGGALEQLVSGSVFYRGSNGRGFLMALDPRTGRILWKYDVGPRPAPLDPPVSIKDSF